MRFPLRFRLDRWTTACSTSSAGGAAKSRRSSAGCSQRGVQRLLHGTELLAGRLRPVHAIKAEQGQAGLCDWPDDLRTRQPAAVAAARERLAGQVDYFKAVQFFFYTQWNALKAYANGKGIQLVGDIPIYVSPDSSDLWTRPELFQTDGQTHLTQVAGCPRMPLRQTVSSGAIRSTTGPATRPRILPGGSAGCSTLLPFMMSCASTTSVVLRATTPSCRKQDGGGRPLGKGAGSCFHQCHPRDFGPGRHHCGGSGIPDP